MGELGQSSFAYFSLVNDASRAEPVAVLCLFVVFHRSSASCGLTPVDQRPSVNISGLPAALSGSVELPAAAVVA